MDARTLDEQTRGDRELVLNYIHGTLLTLETGVPLEKLESFRYYGGFPMSAHHVIAGVKAKLEKAA